jgi:hypothetical protein
MEQEKVGDQAGDHRAVQGVAAGEGGRDLVRGYRIGHRGSSAPGRSPQVGDELGDGDVLRCRTLIARSRTGSSRLDRPSAVLTLS